VSELRNPANVIHTLRCLHILNEEFNFLLEPLVCINCNIILCVCIICNFILVQFQGRYTDSPNQNQFIAILPMLVFAVYCTAFLYLAYSNIGKINSTSRAILEEWQRSTILLEEDRRIMKKYIMSCRPLGMDLGAFGLCHKTTAIRTVLKVMVYTSRLIMLTKRYFQIYVVLLARHKHYLHTVSEQLNSNLNLDISRELVL